MRWLLGAFCGIAGAYQVVAIAACLWHGKRKRAGCGALYPGVSVLKPVRGLAPGLDKAIRSHVEQDYPEFELLLGVREDEAAVLDSTDPRVRVVVCRTVAPNRKVGTLIDLACEARYPVVIVNDADIEVPCGYIREIAGELAEPGTGLVTCLYRADSTTWAGRFEALGIATGFAPSALVAPFAGVSEFGLGATLAFRRADLDRIGGFAAVADYLADDYQLGCKIHALGRRNVMAKAVVVTILGAPSWSAVWRHQVRWSRTVRLSRRAGYLGLPVTFASLWAGIAALSGFPRLGLALLGIRMIMALTAGCGVLRSPDAARLFFLVPLCDLYAAAVWAAALFGDTVEWSGETLKLDAGGRIVSG